jgi:hypothetical protein
MASGMTRSSITAMREGRRGGTYTVGTIAEVTDDGRAFVQFEENPGTPLLARSTLTADAVPAEGDLRGRRVLLVFEDGNLARPIIIGVIHDRVLPPPAPRTFTLARRDGEPLTLLADGKRLDIEAKEEIVLKCGGSSVSLRADGRILIRGRHLVSRASETNAIKGGSVKIN